MQGIYDIRDIYTDDEIEWFREHIVSLMGDGNPLDVLPSIICPGIVGNADAKRALACLLASQLDTARARQRIHVLFYGVAGTAKTGLIDWLVDSWDALYISMDASSATLKGDARRKDSGAKLLNVYDRGIVCIDDFEIFSQKDILRDVMEKGWYTQAKGGKYQKLPARVRIVSACNDIGGISEAMRSRFDIVCYFDMPDAKEATEIARVLATHFAGIDNVDELVRVHMALANEHVPVFGDPVALSRVFERHFSRSGGQTGRWISSVYRIASAIARLRFGDIGEDEVRWALQMKTTSDGALTV
ncbi:MAG: AAA family ATPase [Bacilli bacterium]